MIEENAKKLALWIEGTRSAEEIDPEIVEAVYVLRPDLAPQPQLSSEEIIAQVQAGPFSQSSAPEAIGDEEEIAFEVMQTLMRPDLIEPPKLGIDQILGSLEHGPLADIQPVENIERKIIPLVSRADSAPPKQASIVQPEQEDNVVVVSAWFKKPAIQGTLLAAVALLFVSPMMFTSFQQQPEQSSLLAPESAEGFAKDLSPSVQVPNRGQEEAEEPEAVAVKTKKRSRPTPKPTRSSVASDTDQSLAALRKRAWRLPSVSSMLSPTEKQRLEAAEQQGNAALLALLGDASSNVAFDAAYRIAKSDSVMGREALERVLRLKSGRTVLRRRAYAMLGDLYAKDGNQQKAMEAYIEAISK